MYASIDIGGTKTLVSVLTDDGQIRESKKFPTPANYNHFLLELAHTLHFFEHKEFKAAAVGMPVTVFDRKHGRGVSYGNLPWKNVFVQRDVERLVRCPVVVENDAKLATLSEAMMLKHEFSRVLYITVSTGIGFGFVDKGVIDSDIGDGGGRTILLEHKGKLTPWEDFAGGRAIVARYGKKAMDIHDAATWEKICRDLAIGISHLIAIIQPEVIVIGGSVGTYFDRYGKILTKELKAYHLPLLTMPAIRQAQRPEEAVVYGGYDLAKQTFGHSS